MAASKRSRRRANGARREKKSQARGQAWLAEQLGISQQAVSKHVNRTDWPFDRSIWSEAELPKIKAHIEQRRLLNSGAAAIAAAAGYDEDGLPRDPLTREKFLGMLARRTRTELQTALERGDYMPREEVQRGWLERTQAVREAVGNIRLLVLKLPIAREEIPRVEMILEEWARGVCRRFEAEEDVQVSQPLAEPAPQVSSGVDAGYSSRG